MFWRCRYAKISVDANQRERKRRNAATASEISFDFRFVSIIFASSLQRIKYILLSLFQPGYPMRSTGNASRPSSSALLVELLVLGKQSSQLRYRLSTCEDDKKRRSLERQFKKLERVKDKLKEKLIPEDDRLQGQVLASSYSEEESLVASGSPIHESSSDSICCTEA